MLGMKRLGLPVWPVLLLLLLLPLLATIPASGEGLFLRVAVLPFDDHSIQDRWWEDYRVGDNVSAVFITELLNTKRFRIVERDQIDRVLEEQKLGAAGLTDAQSAASLGRILGVKYLILGSVTEFSRDFRTTRLSDSKDLKLDLRVTTARVGIDVRMVDAATAEILHTVNGKGEKASSKLGVVTSAGAFALGNAEVIQTYLNEAMRTAVGSAVRQLAVKAASNLTIAGLVAYADAERIIIDNGANSGVEPGMIFQVNRLIQEIRDPQTGEILDELTESLGEIQVTEVKPKSATCSALNLTKPAAVNDRVQLKSPPPPAFPEPTPTPKKRRFFK